MIESCETQDVAAERMRRMQLCFRAEAPTAAEVQAARYRYLNRARTRGRPSVGGYLLAMAAGAAATLAVVATSEKLEPEQSPAPIHPEVLRTTTPAGSVAMLGAADVLLEKSGKRVEVRDGMRQSLAAGESAAVILGDSRTELSGPGTLEFRQQPRDAVRWRVRFRPSEALATEPSDKGPARRLPRRRAAASASAPSARPASGAWSRVADALRAQDSTAAERALRQLAEEKDVETRQAARLALAQLQVAQGREQEARTTLEELAAKAAAPLVRKRASDLLQQIQ